MQSSWSTGAEDFIIRERKAFGIITDASLKKSTVDSLCNNILNGLTETLGFDYGIVRLYDEADQHLYVKSTIGITDELTDSNFPPVLLEDNYIISAIFIQVSPLKRISMDLCSISKVHQFTFPKQS